MIRQLKCTSNFQLQLLTFKYENSISIRTTTMFTLAISFIAIISTTTKAQVTCTADVDCIVDCSDGSTTCGGSGKSIDATAATSLTVLCNAQDVCDNSEIYIPNATSATTTIDCSANACVNTEVYYLGDATATPSTHSLNVICSTVTNGCTYMKIYASNAGQVNFHCDDVQCQGLDIFVENVDTVTMQCDKTSTSSYGCNTIELDATNANTVTINCNGDDSCYRNTITATNADTFSVYAEPGGIFAGEYHGENIGSAFDVTCIGDGTLRGCSSRTEFYLPQDDADLSKFSLNCYGDGCWSLELYKPTAGFANIGNANIHWNGCLHCADPLNDCLAYIYTYCGTSTYDNFPYGSNDDCGTTLDCPNCPLVRNAFVDAFTDDTSDTKCVVPSGTISCTANTACVIDCSTESCAGNIIDGSQATSLTVSCNTIDSCEDTIIYPTTKTSSSTEITCGSEGRTSTSQSGCNGDFTIFGNDANELTVIATPYGINQGTIYAQSIAHSFTLTCIGNGTAGSSSSYNRHGCDGPLKVYLPNTAADLNKFHMNCYGTGCGDINLYNDDGFADFDSSNINFNGCLQCSNKQYPDRDAGYNCLIGIRMYCDDASYGIFGTSTTDGFACSAYYQTCSCSTVAQAFETSYTDDTSDSTCILGASAIQCTANGDCAIDCSTQNCAGQIIDASLASGLDMDCTVAESCKDTLIALPLDITSTSTITCSAVDACDDLQLSFSGDASSNPTGHTISLQCDTIDDSCDGVTINADKAGTVRMVCNGVECGDTTLNVDHANTVDISCTGPDTTETSGYGCNVLIVNATEVTGSVQLSCAGLKGCYNSKLYVNNAASVVLDLNGDTSNNRFYGRQADAFDITCYAGFDSQDGTFAGCYQSKFYVPDTITPTNFKLNCYGKGCDDIDVYSANGFASVTSANFYVNGCSDCKLNEIDIGDNEYCAENLAFGCIDTTQSTTSFVSDDFDGYSCALGDSTICGCAEAATVLNAVFTEEDPVDIESCSASLFAYDYDPPPEEEDPTGTVILLIIIMLGLCFVAGYMRKCWLKNAWEKRKKVKDTLATQIEGGDLTKQSEYDEICVTTPDEFEEPALKEWIDYVAWYVADPFFSLFYDRWDKYFAYIAWFGEGIEVIVTLWIIFSLMSPKAAFACCSYSRESALCDPYRAMGEDLSLVDVDDNGWCIVDGTPCVKSYYYDADDPSAMFECFRAERIELAEQWNNEICGEDVRKSEVAANSTWIIVVLLFKLIKIGWDYYITILQFMEKKRVARENTQIVSDYREKHPQWKPNTTKEAKYEEKAEKKAQKEEEEAVQEAPKEEGAGEEKEVETVPKDEPPKDEDEKKEDKAGAGDESVDELGPTFVSEEPIKVFGFISTDDEHWKKFYPYCVMGMFFLGSTLSVAVLAGLDATGGISISSCDYDDYDYESACYNVGNCAYAGDQESSSSSSTGGSEPVYAIVNNNVQLEGPQILAIFATIIAYIGYVPMIREKVTAYMVLKGFKEGEAEADELLDMESWNGLF
eukprot:472571_1